MKERYAMLSWDQAKGYRNLWFCNYYRPYAMLIVRLFLDTK